MEKRRKLVDGCPYEPGYGMRLGRQLFGGRLGGGRGMHARRGMRRFGGRQGHI